MDWLKNKFVKKILKPKSSSENLKQIVAIAYSPQDVGVEYIKLPKEQKPKDILSFLHKQTFKIIYKKITPQEKEMISSNIPVYSVEDLDRLEEILRQMTPGSYKDFIINDTLFRVVSK